MPERNPRPVYLKDYRPPPWVVEYIDLRFDLDEEATLVQAKLACIAREPGRCRALVLAGRDLELRSVCLNGRRLRAAEFQVDGESLTIPQAPDRCTVEIETLLRPQANTALEGLYRSGGNFCTQCEAEGFRKITYFPDRPDVLARYTTTVVADKTSCPVLLANGNLVADGDLEDNRHFAVWEDPFPKPSYLFALVAGDLVAVEDEHVTASGRRVLLQIYVQRHNLDKCAHAMAALKRAMRWDEEVFGLEYDLDRYMIVAVDDFNMGAMENKGLNVFNSKYVLANSDTATDDDFEAIDTVISHEYFHNWTGNRVTCRDWFQLSLKEGLTVFRDQEFSADIGSRPVRRIHDVQNLRSRQFPEDAGPLAHPVRPDCYIEINNFYTMTVYEKGAELIRMLHTLIGAGAFREGLRLYLARFDGKAATTDDFVAAMAEVSGRDLGQFRRWYEQAGTPEVRVAAEHDGAAGGYSLTVTQSCPPTPGQPEKKPLHLPLVVGLLGPRGEELPLRLQGEAEGAAGSRVLELREETHLFRFTGVTEKPVPSLLRGFSAPVKLLYDYTDEELRFLLAHDPDPFNRWEAGQRLACRLILALAADYGAGRPLRLGPETAAPYAMILDDRGLDDKTFASQLLALPAEGYLAEQMAVIDVEAVHAAREFFREALARALQERLLAAYHDNRDPGPYRFEAAAAGRRRLKNLCLAYLVATGGDDMLALAHRQFRETDNMTDCLGALVPLAHREHPRRREVLAAFYQTWQHNPLVLDKWLAIQATAPLPGVLGEVQVLTRHPAFSIRNPNRVRALIGSFATGNPVGFHREDGASYRFLADRVLTLDSLNPQTAARMLGPLTRWRRFGPPRRELMREQLERILTTPALSRDLYEVVAKSLA
ncbi:MAG: aminopeptidase N [Desulfobacteraceae bacterium]|nr:aminopeptidase N [Desulfobacteraceae bacterium]